MDFLRGPLGVDADSSPRFLGCKRLPDFSITLSWVPKSGRFVGN